MLTWFLRGILSVSVVKINHAVFVQYPRGFYERIFSASSRAPFGKWRGDSEARATERWTGTRTIKSFEICRREARATFQIVPPRFGTG